MCTDYFQSVCLICSSQLPKPGGDIGIPTLYLASHPLTNLSINAGHTESARRHGCASEEQILRWAQMLMDLQTTERIEAKRRETKGGFFSR